MPNIIYYSRAILRCPQNTRVLKLVDFEVQKVQKPELFDLAATFPRLRGDQGPLGHVSHTGANFTTKETPGATCDLYFTLTRKHFKFKV